jgi:hypothetical protein
VGDPELGYCGARRAEPMPESPEAASGGAGDPDAGGFDMHDAWDAGGARQRGRLRLREDRE